MISMVMWEQSPNRQHLTPIAALQTLQVASVLVEWYKP